MWSFLGAVVGAFLTGAFTIVAGWVLFQHNQRWKIAYEFFSKFLDILGEYEVNLEQMHTHCDNEIRQLNSLDPVDVSTSYLEVRDKSIDLIVAATNLRSLNQPFLWHQINLTLDHFFKTVLAADLTMKLRQQSMDTNDSYNFDAIGYETLEIEAINKKVQAITNCRDQLSIEFARSLHTYSAIKLSISKYRTGFLVFTTNHYNAFKETLPHRAELLKKKMRRFFRKQ